MFTIESTPRAPYPSLVYKINYGTKQDGELALAQLISMVHKCQISAADLSGLFLNVPPLALAVIKDKNLRGRPMDQKGNTYAHRIVAVNAQAAAFVVGGGGGDTWCIVNKDNVSVAHIAAHQYAAAKYITSYLMRPNTARLAVKAADIASYRDNNAVSVAEIAESTVRFFEALERRDEAELRAIRRR